MEYIVVGGLYAATAFLSRLCWTWGNQNSFFSVLYALTVCPTDSDRHSFDPAISDGPSGQSIGSPLESVGHDWILLLVQAKSSKSPLKPLRSKKWLDWPEFCVHWTFAGFLTNRGRNQSY